MRNIELLTKLTPAERKQLARDRQMMLGLIGIQVDVMAVDENTARIRVEQAEDKNGLILNQKNLVERAKVLFEDYLSRYTFHYVPYTVVPDFDKVTPEWVKEQMDRYGLKSRDVSKHIGIDKSSFSLMLSGNRKLSRLARSALFYYFKLFDVNWSLRDL